MRERESCDFARLGLVTLQYDERERNAERERGERERERETEREETGERRLDMTRREREDMGYDEMRNKKRCAHAFNFARR